MGGVSRWGSRPLPSAGRSCGTRSGLEQDGYCIRLLIGGDRVRLPGDPPETPAFVAQRTELPVSTRRAEVRLLARARTPPPREAKRRARAVSKTGLLRTFNPRMTGFDPRAAHTIVPWPSGEAAGCNPAQAGSTPAGTSTSTCRHLPASSTTAESDGSVPNSASRRCRPGELHRPIMVARCARRPSRGTSGWGRRAGAWPRNRSGRFDSAASLPDAQAHLAHQAEQPPCKRQGPVRVRGGAQGSCRGSGASDARASPFGLGGLHLEHTVAEVLGHPRHLHSWRNW